jgi:hypothetical protein
MRLSIIALASFIICAVFASPITYGIGYNNGLSLSRRGPTTKPAPKPAPKTGKLPATGNKGACGLKKRAPGPVQKAVDASKASPSQGRGGGKAYVVPGGFEGHNAVVKVGGRSASEASIEKEVQMLLVVQQYLGWGIKDGKTYYIVMRNMGQDEATFLKAHTSLRKADLLVAREAAVKHYQSTYAATNPDANVQTGNNFVYNLVGGKAEAEIIDWEIGTTTKALPSVPAPETWC